MIYSGPCRNAQPLLSSCPAVPLETTRCDNPGDFIIDVLGLEDDDDSDAALDSRGCDQSSNALISEQADCAGTESDSFMSPLQRRRSKPDISAELSSHFLQSSEYIILLKRVEEDILILQRPLDLDFRDLGVRSQTPIHEAPWPASESLGLRIGDELEELDNDQELGLRSIPMGQLPSPEHRMALEFLHKGIQPARSKPAFSLPSIMSDSDAGRSSRWAGNLFEVKILQLWVLFARRVTVDPPPPPP